MNLLLKIISANDKWDGFTIVITTNVISNTHKYVICIYIWLIQITHTTKFWHQSHLYSEKVWKITVWYIIVQKSALSVSTLKSLFVQ